VSNEILMKELLDFLGWRTQRNGNRVTKESSGMNQLNGTQENENFGQDIKLHIFAY